MTDGDSHSLLRRFADHGDEVAFRELVNRHLALAYAAALRQTHGVSHLAEEVAQSVFTLLARQAKKLTTHPTLEGWLFTTTRNCARDAMRAASRRRRYEQETAAMHEPTATSSPGEVNWTALAPTIDEALSRLSPPDREGILLRFFEKRSYAELGERLGLTENTARMRVERALERLRHELKRRGITSTAALLAVALSNQTAVAVPAHLSVQIAAVALAKTVTVAAAGGGLVGIFEFMKATKVICAIGLLAVGAAIYEGNVASVAVQRAEKLEHEQGTLKVQIDDLQQKFAAAQNRAQAADDDNARLLIVVGQVQHNASVSTQNPSRTEVEKRYQRAKDLAKAGDYAQALSEYLWCYDEGMLAGNLFVRRTYSVIPELGELAAKYPAALAALRERGVQAAAKLRADLGDTDAAANYGQILRALKDDSNLLSMWATLPLGDARQTLLMNGAYDALVSARRYGDAAAAKPFGQMVQDIEMMAGVNVPDTAPGAAVARKQMRESIVKTAADNFEVLAGAGSLAQAQTLAKKLLVYDNTPATKSLLMERAARAGRPELAE